MPQRSWGLTNRPMTGVGMLLALAACLVIGCGKQRTYTVTGKVTFRGGPVKEGTIMFLNPTTQDANQAPLGTDGTYTIKVPPGSYQVVVQPTLMQIGGQTGPPDYVLKGADDIPERYRQPETTDLRAEITANATIDFDMQKGANR